ncbi:hypothetical protein JT359_12715 [Candidatus Poribacteria bacterium]|nr:hypothetical protein [Candidatus Poribacteria bacterium]
MSRTLPLLLITLFIVGCAGYKFQEVETGLNGGQPENAYNYLKKHEPKKPDIPHKYELALTAHYANQYNESSKAFDIAEQIAEERYTKSVSTEALSLITSDRIRPYVGKSYERLLAHYYHALNYIKQNKLEEALVECRRATNLIQFFIGEEKEYDYFGAGFLAYFSGILFEASGELNDALISYKQAEQYYKSGSDIAGIQVPDDLGYSLVRVSRKLNFQDDFERFSILYGDTPQLPENHGELILFYETGYVPRKGQQTLTFPILKTDRFGEDDSDSVKFARTLRGREGLVVEEIKLEYLLHVAIPIIDSFRPAYKGLTISVDGKSQEAELVEDIETVAILTLKSERTAILIRTLVRALGKYLITRKAKKQNEVLGALTNLAGVLTESADRRSWQTLPNQIYMVRMPLPSGIHNLQLSFLNENGYILNTQSLRNVEIAANKATILNYRTYR